jgi:hypothetical protein
VAISYNTGSTGDNPTSGGTGISHTIPFTFTVPAGVLTGDVMIAVIECFSFTQTTPSFSTPTSGGGSWTQIGSLLDSGAGSGLNSYATAWWRAATGSDPGSTFSISYTGTVGTDQFFWGGALASYTGADTTTPIDVSGTAVAVGVGSITLPARTTGVANDWAVYLGAAGFFAAGTWSGPAGTTQRQAIQASDEGAAIYDSNGSVGAAGTSIGGGTYSATNSSWWGAWTIGLAPPSSGTTVQLPQRQRQRKRQTLQRPPAAPVPGQLQPRPTLTPPRRDLARAVTGVRPRVGAAFIAVPAPLQGPYRPPRRTPGRVVWRGGAGQGFVPVPAPAQLPPVPRRKPGRVLWAGNAVSSVTFAFVAVPAPAQPPPVPRRRLARGVWGGVHGAAYLQVPAPGQGPRTVFRRVPARGVWRGGAGQGFAAVPAPLQGPYRPPRRRLARAVIQFTPVTTTNQAAAAAGAGTVQPWPTQTWPRRRRVRAAVQFTPVFTVNAPGIGCINKQIAADAPAAWWRLADAPGSPVAADSGISHAYPGTLTAVTFGLPGPDPIPGSGTAASLNGTTSRVLSTYNPVLAAVTVEAWVNLNGLHQVTSFGRLVSDSFTQSDNHGFELLLNAGSVTFAVGSGAAFSLISGGTIPPSGWTQVAGTWDGTTISLYVNGSVVGSAPFAGSLSAGTASGVSIGYNSTYNGDFVGGLMAEVAIYPAALSPARVAARYACVVPPVPSGVITGGQSAGGDRDPWIREFRSIMPGEVPELGGQLPRLHGRGYAAPAPSRAEDVEVLWEAPPEPAAEPGPSIAEIVSDSARAAGAGLYGLGRILAPEPYVSPSRVKCGALRKIGMETLRCSRKRGHPGLHSDRGVKWG